MPASRRNGSSGYEGRAAALPLRYAVRLVARIGLQFALIALLITGIFLGEKFAAVVNAALEEHADLYDVLLILPLTVPETIDLVIPIALLIAVYRVALRAREDREFVVLAAAGIGVREAIWLALIIGFAGQLVSLSNSGFVEPHARFAHREIVFSARNEALSGGGAVGKFYRFPNETVFAQLGGTRNRVLFVQRPADSDIYRMIVAGGAKLEVPEDQGWVTLRLIDTATYDFPAPPAQAAGPPSGSQSIEPCENCPPRNMSAPVFSMRIQDFARDIKVDQLFRAVSRGETTSEWTLPELAGLAPPPGAIGKAHLSDAAKRIFRSFLPVAAPLLALLALTFTGRATLPFALPAACVLLMVTDIAGTATADLLAGGGIVQAVGLLAAILAALVTLLAWQLAGRHRDIVSPGLAKA